MSEQNNKKFIRYEFLVFFLNDYFIMNQTKTQPGRCRERLFSTLFLRFSNKGAYFREQTVDVCASTYFSRNHICFGLTDVGCISFNYQLTTNNFGREGPQIQWLTSQKFTLAQQKIHRECLVFVQWRSVTPFKKKTMYLPCYWSSNYYARVILKLFPTLFGFLNK